MKLMKQHSRSLALMAQNCSGREPSERIYTSKEEKTMQAFKAVKYQYMLLSAAIVAGDDKLKLSIIGKPFSI